MTLVSSLLTYYIDVICFRDTCDHGIKKPLKGLLAHTRKEFTDVVYIMSYFLFLIYSQTCIQRSPLGQMKNYRIRQLTA